MWELRKNSAHGRISVRRFSLVATAVMVAIFALTSLLSPRALAADATREGDKVAYDGRTFTLMTAAERPSGIQRDVTGYASLDEANKKAHFIFTTGDASKAKTGQYVIYDFIPPANFSNSSPPITVAIADKAPTTGSTDTGEGATGCNGQFMQGIGWILCPVVNFLASGMDHLYDILSSFLVVQPAQSTADSSLFKIWSVVRSIANICFVIGFLVVIFSQITSAGITNYGVKRIMPRLIIAAILVNISFWICALAIDVSNTLGYGIHSLFMGVFDSLNTAGAYQQNITWSSVATTILSGTAVAGLAAFGIYGAIGATTPGLLITFIPTLLGVMISALVALLVVSVRQALIVCLVIVSPLAFVAFLLPNTEKYFTKWRELFLTLLLVYPIFAVVFGGAQLAGMAIIQNANGSLSLIILGMAAQIAPVVVTPLLIKVSGSLVGQIAALANKPRESIMNKTKTWADGRAAEEKARLLSDTRRNGRTARLSRAVNDRRRLHEGQRKEFESSDDNRFARTERGTRLEKMRRTNANMKQHGDNLFNASDDGMRLERESKRLGVVKNDIDTSTMNGTEGYALRKLMSDSDSYKTESENTFNSHELGQQARGRRDMAEVGKTRADNAYNGTQISRDVEDAKRHAELIKEGLGADHQARWDNSVRTTPDVLLDYVNSKSSTVQAEVAKQKLDKTYSEIVALGDGSEHVLNLRNLHGINQATKDQILSVSKDIQVGSREVSAIAMAKGMAERVAKEDLAKVYSETAEGTQSVQIDGVDIHKYAAGLKGKSGELAVLAKAKSETSVPLTEDIKNIKTTLGYLESTSPFELLTKFKDPASTLEERVAYATVMTERGGPGNVALRQALDFLDTEYASNPDNQELQDFKELVASGSGAMKSGKDIEFWLTNARESGTNKLRTLKDLSNDDGTWNALQVDSFVGMSLISQFKALRTYARNKPDLYTKLVADIKADPHSYAQIKPAVKETMEHLASETSYWTDAAIKARAGNSPDFDFDNPW